MTQRDDATEWVTVFEAGTDYEADLVRDRLADSGIPAVILAHRDHAFQLTVGSMSRVAVRVPGSRRGEAVEILGSGPIGDHELTRIALAADPNRSPEEPGSALGGGIVARRRPGPSGGLPDTSGERD